MKKMNLKLTGMIALSLLIFSCGKAPSVQPGSEEEGADAPVVEKSYNVRTTTVVKQELSSYIDLSGDVEASVTVSVYPEAAGKLDELNVKLGSTVRKDQVIAVIDPSRPGMNYAESPVKAPISGTVTAVNVDPGMTVSQQVALVTIGKIDQLVITTQVPERFLYMVKEGQSAFISTTAAPDRRYDARVTALSPVVNPVSRTLEVELTMSGRTPVKAGMFVGIRLITSTEADALVVPEKALIRRNSEIFVYRAAGNLAEKVPVELGLESEGSVEIINGLSEGDQVITEGVSLLSDGSKIKVLRSVSVLKETDENSEGKQS